MTSRKKEDAISPKAWPPKSQIGAADQRDPKGPPMGQPGPLILGTA